MHSTVKSLAKSNRGIEVLEGVSYDIQTANRFRKLKVGARARLFVAEATSYVPQNEFEFVQNRVRFRLKLDGPLERALVYCKLILNRDATRQRERYFRPVRILGMDPLPQPPASRLDDPRPIQENELGLIDALLPPPFPNRERILKQGELARVRELTESVRYLWWPNPIPYGGRCTFSREFVNAGGEKMTITLEVRDSVPDRLVARRGSGGLAPFPDVREVCLA